MDWIQKNFRTIIYISFLVPILLVAFVSISHVTTWYGLANPMSWAIYLSVGIEIAALSALAAISAQMGSRVYLSFGIVTLIQFIGNIFFAYQFIDTDSEQFKDWVDLVDPIVSYLGVESGNIVSHKRFLALFSGGMLPIISLSFLHMLVKFEEEDKKNRKEIPTQLNVEEISREIAKKEGEEIETKYTPTEEELKKLEEELIRINELKFGKLVEDTAVEQNIEVLIEESPKEEDFVLGTQTSEELVIDEVVVNEPVIEEVVVNEPVIEEVVVNEPVIEENVELITKTEDIVDEDSISEIQVEPDFYKEEEADYSLEEENKPVNNVKTLKYFRPH